MNVQINSILILLIILCSCSSPIQTQSISEKKVETSVVNKYSNVLTSKAADTLNLSKCTIKQDLYASLKSDVEHFLSVDIDYDLDGKIDKIFYNSFLNGDSMYIFQNKGHNFSLSLKTINFSEDGLFKIDTIKSVMVDSLHCIVISSHFNGSGGLQKDEYLYFNTVNKQWFLLYSIFKDNYCTNEKKCKKTVCKIKQNIRLHTQTNWSKYRHYTEANKSECTVIHYNNK